MSVRRLVTVALIVVAGIVPLAVQLASLWDRRSSLSIPSDASVGGSRWCWSRPCWSCRCSSGSLLARSQDRVRIEPVPARSSTLVLLGGWLLVPVVTLYVVSALTPVDFLSPRYFASVGPAIALFAGWGIASLEPRGGPRIVGDRARHHERPGVRRHIEERGGLAGSRRVRARHADPGTVVLFHPALVESAQLDWFSDPEKRSYLLSVQSYYPMEGG